jgi:hypothetical protein
LLEVKEHGLIKIDKICQEVLSAGICNADFIVARIKQRSQAANQELFLAHQPDADCSCYDKKLLKQETEDG